MSERDKGAKTLEKVKKAKKGNTKETSKTDKNEWKNNTERERERAP